MSTSSVANTGASAGCISAWGANDMVGNVAEWVADWDEQANGGCASWPAGFGSDESCVGNGEGDTGTRFPGALFRGGEFGSGGTGAGPFALNAINQPSSSGLNVGFRGAR